MKCDMMRCLANLNGECVADECKGELVMLPSMKSELTKKARKMIYHVSATYFEEDFGEKDDDR